MSCLPSATYAGPGSTDNLWIPADGSATIRGNLEVTGNEMVDGDAVVQSNLGVVGQAFFQTAVFGTGTSVPVAFPAGAVGGTNTPDARAILSLPLGFRLSNGSADQSSVTAGTSGGFGTAIFSDGIQVNRGAQLALSGGGVSIGSPTAQGGLNIEAGPGMGSLASPVSLAPGATFQMNGNKCFVTITSAGSVTINQANTNFVPSAWCFTDNTQTIQSYFRTSSAGVITLTAIGGAQTFGVVSL